MEATLEVELNVAQMRATDLQQQLALVERAIDAEQDLGAAQMRAIDLQLQLVTGHAVYVDAIHHASVLYMKVDILELARRNDQERLSSVHSL